MRAQRKFSLCLELFDHQSTAVAGLDLFTVDEIQSISSTATESEKQLYRTISNLDPRRSHVQLTSLEMYYKGTFVETSTKDLALGPGIVHLYREIPSRSPTSQELRDLQNCASQQDGVLAILAVPSYMTSSDLLGFFGDSLRKISHIRILKIDDLRRYMVLLKFHLPSDSFEFQQKFNGAMFNAMEPETVHCIPIFAISFCGQLRSASEFPMLTGAAAEVLKMTQRLTQKARPPTMSLTELPTCVVCLDRLDSATTGLLTTACEHTFHCACISKWSDLQSTCPICRFSTSGSETVQSSERRCNHNKCVSEKNLWLCLICGTINCGRYESQHAYVSSLLKLN